MTSNKKCILAFFIAVLLQVIVCQDTPAIVPPAVQIINITSTFKPSTTILPTDTPPSNECRVEDFGATFSECDSQTQTMLVVYFKKRECKGDVPPSTQRIACNIECNNGEVLEAPSTTCKKCPPGHFSFSEGNNIINWNEEKNNPNLKTYCIGNACKKQAGWVIHKTGTYIHSGVDQPDNVQLVLVHSFEIVRQSGSIEFTFLVDADRSDGLEFYIDGEIKMPRTSFVNVYSTRRYEDLSPGLHKVEWRYIKNDAISKGKDRAQISNIKVYGTKFHDNHCTACGPGTYAENEGSQQCDLCPMFTYADTNSTAKCKSCPEEKYSLEGASSCILRPNCTKDDFTSSFTKCKNNVRTLHYELKVPVICNLATTDPSTVPQDKTNLTCPVCPKGYYRDTRTYECIRCTGTAEYYDRVKKTCSTCPSGTAALKFSHYGSDYFAERTKLPSTWTAKCHGPCSQDSRGWSVAHDPATGESFLQSGGSEGQGDMTTLEFKTQLYTHSRISFKYNIIQNITYLNQDEGATLSFYINSNLMVFLDRDSGNKNGAGNYTSPYLAPGNYTLFFGFEKYDSNDENALIQLKDIVIEGDQDGAADQCLDCPPGFKCEDHTDRFIPCSPGQYSNGKSEKCSLCPSGTYNDEYAHGGVCSKCAAGTRSDEPGSTHCINECQYNVPGTHIYYDLRDLEAASTLEFKSFGPITFGNYSDMKLYFSLCNRFNNSATSFCNTQRIGMGLTVNEFNSYQSENLVAYSCLQHDDLSFDMGSTIAYTNLLTPGTSDIDPEKRGDGFRIEMTSKEMCVAPNEDDDEADIRHQVLSADRAFKTVINFICNPKVGRGQPMPIHPPDTFSNIFTTCQIDLRWETVSACPLCTKYDYDEVLGECQADGYRYSTFYPRTNTRCNPYGHVPAGVDNKIILPPLNRTQKAVKCPVCTMENDVEFVDTKCHNGEYTRRYMWKYPKNCSEALSNFLLPDPEVRTCEDVDVSRMTVLIVFTLAVMTFSGMCIGYILLYRRHQQLYRNYQMLQQTDSRELKNVEVFGGDESDDSQEEDMGFAKKKKSTKTVSTSVYESDEDDDDERV